MARIKTTYGKRPKAAPAFADFWSSPTNKSTTPPDSTTIAPTHCAVDDITSTFDGLEISERKKQEKKDERKKEKRDRALQAIDGNVASSPVCTSAGEKKPTAKTHVPEVAAAPKTPQRVKKLLPPKKKKVDEVEAVEQTPPTERRRRARRGKRDIPTICLDSEDEDAAVAVDEAPDTEQHQPKQRLRAPSTPEPARFDPVPPTATRTTTSRKPRSKSAAPTPAPPPDPLTAYTKPLLRLCADRAGRRAPTPFSAWAAALAPHFAVSKIAEASYGEVYRLALKRAHPGLGRSDESVLKLIALKPPPNPAAKKKKRKTKKERQLEDRIAGMSGVADVAGEIRLLKRMAAVPGFTNFRDVRVLRGSPAATAFARAWREWDEGREEEKKSIFPDPAEEGSYGDEQLWAVIEMQDAGTDLENVRMEDVGGVFGVWDIFWSVTLALAKGEEEARFEHRDLHMGNICIRPAAATRPIAAPATAAAAARNLHFTGLESTIIDYTLSRAQLTHPTASPEPAEAEIAFLDLEADPALFAGDAAAEYQYEVYRLMRGAMYLDDPLADVDACWEDEVRAGGRSWVGFHPQTNLVWLHFVLGEMMGQVERAAAAADLEVKKKKGGKSAKSKNKKATAASRTTKKKAAAVVIPDSEDKAKADDDGDNDDSTTIATSQAPSPPAAEAEQAAEHAAALDQLIAAKRRKLDKILRKVQRLLDPHRGGCGARSGLRSAKDVVALALEEAWLGEEDVIDDAPGLVGDGEGSLLELVGGMGV